MIHRKRQILFVALHRKLAPKLLGNNVAHAIFQFLIKETVPAVILDLPGHGLILPFQVRPVANVRIFREAVVPIDGTSKHLLCLRKCVGKQVRNPAVPLRSVGKTGTAVAGSHKGSLAGCTSGIGPRDCSCHAGQDQVSALIFSNDAAHRQTCVAADRAVDIRIVNAA